MKQIGKHNRSATSELRKRVRAASKVNRGRSDPWPTKAFVGREPRTHDISRRIWGWNIEVRVVPAKRVVYEGDVWGPSVAPGDTIQVIDGQLLVVAAKPAQSVFDMTHIVAVNKLTEEATA